MEELFDLIRQWGHDRNLIYGSTTEKQMLKLNEEMGELAHGFGKKNQDEVNDAIGDMVVVLTLLAAQCGVNIEECIESAYHQIKDRKGKMINGLFVKEE